MSNNKFPDSLKLSDITPVYKKFDPSDKANYRPVSALPLLLLFFLIGIHSMQGWSVTTRHGVKRKKKYKKIKAYWKSI